MILNTFYASDPAQDITAPYPQRNGDGRDGWFFALRGGDFFGVSGGWTDPKHVYRDYFDIPRPFLSWRRGRFGFYIGWKAWGPSDKKAFATFPGVNPATEVWPGSLCLQGFTWRVTTHLAT